MKSEHIKVRCMPDGVDLLVDDRELFDYVDDVVVDSGLRSDYTRQEEDGRKHLYVIHFGNDVPKELIIDLVERLPEEEVERIWLLNN